MSVIGKFLIGYTVVKTLDSNSDITLPMVSLMMFGRSLPIVVKSSEANVTLLSNGRMLRLAVDSRICHASSQSDVQWVDTTRI